MIDSAPATFPRFPPGAVRLEMDGAPAAGSPVLADRAVRLAHPDEDELGSGLIERSASSGPLSAKVTTRVHTCSRFPPAI